MRLTGFWDKLKGVSDPEKKRKIIGNEFISVFAAEAQKLQQGEGGRRYRVSGAGDVVPGCD